MLIFVFFIFLQIFHFVLNCDFCDQENCLNLGQYLVPIHRYCCFCNADPNINHVYTVNEDNLYTTCKTEATYFPGSPGALIRLTSQNILDTYCPSLIRVASFNDISTTDLILAFGEAEIFKHSTNSNYQLLELLGYCSPESGYCNAYVPVQSIIGSTPSGRRDHFYTSSDSEKEEANLNKDQGGYKGIKCYVWDNMNTKICIPKAGLPIFPPAPTFIPIPGYIPSTNLFTPIFPWMTTSGNPFPTPCPSGSFPVFIASGTNISHVGDSFVKSFSCQNGEIVCLQTKNPTWTTKNGNIFGDYTINCQYPCIVDAQGTSWYPNSPWAFDRYYLRSSCSGATCGTYLLQFNSLRDCNLPSDYGLTNGVNVKNFFDQFSDCTIPIVNSIFSTTSISSNFIQVKYLSCSLFPCVRPRGCPFFI